MGRADVFDASAEQIFGGAGERKWRHDRRRARRRRDVRRAAVIADEQAQPRGGRDEIDYFRRFDCDGALAGSIAASRLAYPRSLGPAKTKTRAPKL